MEVVKLNYGVLEIELWRSWNRIIWRYWNRIMEVLK